MKSKIIALLVMIMTFALVQAQEKYPIQTIFKGDSVVILKYDQVMDINNLLSEKSETILESGQKIKKYESKILTLKDTIKDLRSKLRFTESDLSGKLIKSRDSLLEARCKIMEDGQKISFYEKEMRRIEKLEFVENRTRFQVKFGIGLVIATWIFGILTN